jgi:hypothetical protein
MLVIDLRIDAKDLLRDGLPNGQAGAFWKSQGLLEAASRLAAVLDTEGDRQEPEPGLALTLQNDFLAIGRLIQDGRADFERIAEWSHRLIQALSRYFHDDKLIMFDREGLIKFIDNQPPAERHNCVDHPLADHEWICLTCLDAKDEPSEPIADTEGDQPHVEDRRQEHQCRSHHPIYKQRCEGESGHLGAHDSGEFQWA